MENKGEARLMRIFISSTDKLEHTTLHEAIVFKAKKYGMAGATVTRGMLGFGASSVIHTSKFWEVTEKIPTVVEIIDEEAKVMAFYETLRPVLTEMRYGCLVTVEKVDVLLYKPGKKSIL